MRKRHASQYANFGSLLIYTHKTIDAFELSMFNNFNLNKTKLIFEPTIIFDKR